MATFDIDPTSDIAIVGWSQTSDTVWEDLSIPEGGGDTYETTTDDDNSNACILGGVSLPGIFPADGADSVSYHIRMRIQDDKNIDPLPQMKFQITTSGNAEIANVTVSLGETPEVFADYTGSMTITGNNTSTDWTGHRMRLETISNDSDHTDFEVAELQATVTYSTGSVFIPGTVRVVLNENIIQPPMTGYHQ